MCNQVKTTILTLDHHLSIFEQVVTLPFFAIFSPYALTSTTTGPNLRKHLQPLSFFKVISSVQTKHMMIINVSYLQPKHFHLNSNKESKKRNKQQRFMWHHEMFLPFGVSGTNSGQCIFNF